MKFLKDENFKIALLLTFITIISFLLVIKMVNSPITIDEAASFDIAMSESYLGIITRDISPKYASSNNHIINTITIKFFTETLGVNNLTIRMGSFLSFLGYILSTFIIVKLLFPKKVLVNFIPLVSIIGLVDIFTIARGYASLLFITSLTLAIVIYSFKTKNNKLLILTNLLAASSIFTHLLGVYFIAANSLIILFVLINNSKKINFMTIGIVLETLILSIASLIYVKTSFESILQNELFNIGGSQGFLNETIHSIYWSIFGPFTNTSFLEPSILGIIFILLFSCGIIVYTSYSLFNHRSISEKIIPGLYFLFLLLIIIIANLLINSPFPNYRTASFLLPFFLISVLVYIHEIEFHQFRITLSNLITISALFLFITNFSFQANVYYLSDSSNYKIIDFINQSVQEDSTIMIDSSIHGSIEHYFKTGLVDKKLKVYSYYGAESGFEETSQTGKVSYLFITKKAKDYIDSTIANAKWELLNEYKVSDILIYHRIN